MTTIAWDGKTLSADRQMTQGNSKNEYCKLFFTNGVYFATCGDIAHSLLMMAWFLEQDERIELFPEPKNDRKGVLVVLDPVRGLLEYDTSPIPLQHSLERNLAWGSGRDFAIAAMAMGANSKQAIEIACLYDCYTGFGVDSGSLP